jgi:MtN3 and saliva related transmembrane protein
MQMTLTTALGLLAGFLTTISQIPQAIKIIKTRHTHDISLSTYVLVTMGIALWLVYGFLIRDYTIIGANSITLVITIIILTFKIKYK